MSIRGLLVKLGLQSRESPNLGDFGTPEIKSHLDVGPVERCIVYYKGEGGGFPQVRAVVSLVCLYCMWFVLTPKVLQLHTNHLVWVLCKPVWLSEACQVFLVPSWSSSTPFYPLKCCELGSVPRLLLPLFSTWTHIWVFQGVGSASKWILALFGMIVKKWDGWPKVANCGNTCVWAYCHSSLETE
jgi:hypothetical protein